MKNKLFFIGIVIIGIIMLGVFESLDHMQAGKLYTFECIGVMAVSYFLRLLMPFSGKRYKCQPYSRAITVLIFSFNIIAKCIKLENSFGNIILLSTSIIVFIVGEIVFEIIVKNLEVDNNDDSDNSKSEITSEG